MLSLSQAIILGLLQGFTELFPISSLGHSVLLPSLLGWNINQHDPAFLVFLVATHLATALVLIGFYFKDWILVAQGFLRSLLHRRIDPRDTYARLAWLLVIATIPAGLLGLLFQKRFGDLFGSPHLVAVFLIGNGVLLYAIEHRRRRAALSATGPAGIDGAIARLSFVQALRTGTLQALALFPGFSRTGSALAGGLFSGLDHESAARFSFLLATPIILAAAVLKLSVLFTDTSAYPITEIIVGMIASGFAALFSLLFLTRYFKTHTLMPFAVYCMAAGALSLGIFILQ